MQTANIGHGTHRKHRSTHGLSLTDEGDTFLAYGRHLLDNQRVPIVAVMLQERQCLPKIRACIDDWAR